MHRYQIILFDNGFADRAAKLRVVLEQRLTDLGIPADAVRFFDASDVNLRDHKAPIVAAYFSERQDHVVPTELKNLLAEAALVLPLVPSLKCFTAHVPAELVHINGFVWDGTSAAEESAAAVLLEGLALLRKSRRLFISYLRQETSSIAIKLFEFFESHGFDVFLDTHSVRPGEVFQEVLWHRLSDTDVVIALDSPSFNSSRWTTEEVLNASLTNILVLQVLWPGRTLDKAAALNKPFELIADSFVDPLQTTGKDSLLRPNIEEDLLREVESLRARAMAARHSYLIQEFTSAATAAGYTPSMQPERFITLTREDGSLLAAVPTVGIPDAFRYEEIEELLDQYPKRHNELVLIFDDRGVLKRWLKHLRWLDGHKLKVRSTSVANIPSLLETR